MENRCLRISPEDIREALRLPDDFVCDDKRIGVTWALGPVLKTRDSGFAARANAKALLEYLSENRETPEVEEDWYVLCARHWACGWVEQIAFRVFERGRVKERIPSRIFELLLDWKEGLENDPIANREIYEEERKEDALEYIWQAHGIHVKTGAPRDWNEQVFEILDRKGQIIEEPSGDLYISSDEINEALKELGYYDDEDE